MYDTQLYWSFIRYRKSIRPIIISRYSMVLDRVCCRLYCQSWFGVNWIYSFIIIIKHWNRDDTALISNYKTIWLEIWSRFTMISNICYFFIAWCCYSKINIYACSFSYQVFKETFNLNFVFNLDFSFPKPFYFLLNCLLHNSNSFTSLSEYLYYFLITKCHKGAH